MYHQSIPLIGSFDAWRKAARNCLARGVPPEHVTWSEEGSVSLFASAPPEQAAAVALKVPAAFLDLARLAVCHRDMSRFGHLYDVLWRLQSMPRLLQDESDPAIAALRNMAKAVSRDSHKMKAFVRFREVEADAGHKRRRFAAWFEPGHHIVELTAPFFARRFADMDWLIATPSASASLTDGELAILPGMPRPAGSDDVTVKLWQTYYASIFNPARLKVKAMTSEMPRKYWKNLPEAALIPDLIATAATRAAGMQKAEPTVPARRIPAVPPAQANPPSTDDIAALRREAEACRRCDLHRMATQVVFGEGPAPAPLMLVGEQPGDKEDLGGRPFVGPAGQLLDRALAAAGIQRSACYLTNAVKHFKYELRGKLRLHKSPDRSEVTHCRWWIERELAIVRPATGCGPRRYGGLQSHRRWRCDPAPPGRVERLEGKPPVFVTVHPSSILRAPDAAQVDQAFAAFVDDLKQVRALLDAASRPASLEVGVCSVSSSSC